jgi:hypothetical protein
VLPVRKKESDVACWRAGSEIVMKVSYTQFCLGLGAEEAIFVELSGCCVPGSEALGRCTEEELI